MNIQITDLEMMEDILWGSDVWEVVEGGEWTQDHQYQRKESVVKHIPTGKFYQCEVSRSGSTNTAWCYSYECGDYPDLYEVTQEERTIVQKYWKAV